MVRFPASRGVELLIRQRPKESLTLGTGVAVWDAGRVLASLVSSEPHSPLRTGSSVLELGSGTGVVGLACAAAGASRVVLSDLSRMLPLLRDNAAATNSLLSRGPVVTVAELEWGVTDLSGFIASHFPDQAEPDVIVGADVVFIESQITPLLTVLKALSSSRTTILISTEIRDQNCFKKFMEQAELDFELTRVREKKLPLVVENVQVHRLRRKEAAEGISVL